MSAEPRRFITPEEYLMLERDNETKHEYLDGNIYAMAGASRRHNTIALNIGTSLRIQLRGTSCRAYLSEMRVKVQRKNFYTYPDISVVCGKQEIETEGLETLLNPNLIIEVLSPSTERYDRGRKFFYYQMLDSLQEYLLVAQDALSVEQYVRSPEGIWQIATYFDIDQVIQLSSINCTLRLVDIYEDVDVTEQEGA